LSLGVDMCYLCITKILLILFAMYVHMHLFALHTTRVFLKQNQTQEKNSQLSQSFVTLISPLPKKEKKNNCPP